MNYLFFLDIETTGLDHHWDDILEIGCKVTEFSNPTKIIDTFRSVCRNNGSKCSPFVEKMHTQSGLLTECMRSTVTVSESLLLLYSFINQFDGTRYLAGNSVHFDVNFVSAYVSPYHSIKDLFHHRHLDMSVFKIFSEINPSTIDRGLDNLLKNHPTHRVLEDIDECIKQFDYWNKRLSLRVIDFDPGLV